ncbi:toll/interleukin-1 receptor domain-containing protein [Streptomyces cavernicola]|uniref:Toll/interleukin-1 receptor domain-containing protein n=1 Tax=Streptomyces cavernicola TaxID=3043613 RepID=A0ABT6SGT3_9ACTN|nr:toll/interleukin-1 receptor domain-containing protein [Streptomyces sp. B-S-A6]MDI3406613.1 toll/interleukin-1 receptor domain-containing protein [Streptomyces sp. B-S-A6]
MPKIFINYRSGNGDHMAAALDENLRRRFGPDAVFRDGRSLRPGTAYPQALLRELRRSSVLLVVIGPDWGGSPRLLESDDWVRREILEAQELGLDIVPVIDAAAGRFLDGSELPSELTWLSRHQALSYAPYTAVKDLAAIGDALLDLVPDLVDLSTPPVPAESGGTHNSVSGGSSETLVQGRDFSGDIGTVIKGNSGGQFHTGKGDQHVHHHNDSTRFTVDGGTFVAGSHNRAVNHRTENGRGNGDARS